ncbi:hypothetical protein FFLO_02861 [Filobasidium floriforme]|uniref:protein-tyrosine-phosphatase n=1 Tax=Filobasidium floriforme TaxID=5210 RepID=A0A8K0JLT4_9TREE|nr:hypothetical protein FFLO_02861 [Filobasidium floriforme]
MFDVDDVFYYTSFAEDHGPFNIGLVARFHDLIQRMLVDARLKGHHLVLYSLEEPDRKSNGACLAAVQALLANKLEPYQLICQLSDFELKPFRDAARGRSEWSLSIQDILDGAHRAQQLGLVDLNKIMPDEYEKYEQVEYGDLNTIGPFVPFASPRETAKSPRLFHPRTQSVLTYFERSDVRAVVRLNDPLYDSGIFTNKGIGHFEMEFPDGSNPPLDLVRKFIRYADEIIKAGGKVAVHCKAGLGRSGVIVSAYLIYKYGFTGHEAIGLMRLIRPGMVVGPQQQWLVGNAGRFSRWVRLSWNITRLAC